MSRRSALGTLVLGVAWALGGCAQYYYGERAGRPAIDTDLVTRSHEAADALLHQVALDASQPVLVGTVVQLDRLEHSSRLGRLVSEQLAGRLTQRGLRVAELRLRDALVMRPGRGELLLSRHAAEVSQAQVAQAVLVGTYAAAPRAVYISLKLVGPQGNNVLAAHDYSLPLTDDIRGMLASSY